MGWLLLQAWRYTLGRPVYALGRWIEQRAAGVPLRYRATDVPKLRRRPAWLQAIDPWRNRRERTARGATPGNLPSADADARAKKG